MSSPTTANCQLRGCPANATALTFSHLFLLGIELHLPPACVSKHHSGMEAAALAPKLKPADGSKRRDGLFVCPCSTCSPKPIDPLAPRKSSSSDASSCIFGEPPIGTLPPPPAAEYVVKEVAAGETVKVRPATRGQSLQGDIVQLNLRCLRVLIRFSLSYVTA